MGPHDGGWEPVHAGNDATVTRHLVTAVGVKRDYVVRGPAGEPDPPVVPAR